MLDTAHMLSETSNCKNNINPIFLSFFFLQYFYILGKRVKVTLKKSFLKFKPAKREEEDI